MAADSKHSLLFKINVECDRRGSATKRMPDVIRCGPVAAMELAEIYGDPLVAPLVVNGMHVIVDTRLQQRGWYVDYADRPPVASRKKA